MRLRHKEHEEFEKEWRELGRLIENDKKMKEFMRTKERQRDEEIEKGRIAVVTLMGQFALGSTELVCITRTPQKTTMFCMPSSFGHGAI